MPTGFSTVAPRVIYLVRNPKDVVVSYMHHMTLFKIDQFEGDLEDMVRHPFHPNQQLKTCQFQKLTTIVVVKSKFGISLPCP